MPARRELGRAWVEHLAWRPAADGAMLAAAAGRKLFYLNPDATVRQEFKDAPKTITALAWHPKGGCAAVAYFGGVCLWDSDGAVAQREYAYGNGIQALAWSPDCGGSSRATRTRACTSGCPRATSSCR
jgi:hypothetical protein